MRTTPTPISTFLARIRSARGLQAIALGTLCSAFAFAIGLETAGEVRPFDTSEAAVQSTEPVVRVAPKGDVDGDGELEAEDAAMLLSFVEGLDAPDAEQERRGDVDGDFRLTSKDVFRILHSLSLR